MCQILCHPTMGMVDIMKLMSKARLVTRYDGKDIELIPLQIMSSDAQRRPVRTSAGVISKPGLERLFRELRLT